MEMGSRGSHVGVVRAAWASQVEAILVEFHHATEQLEAEIRVKADTSAEQTDARRCRR